MRLFDTLQRVVMRLPLIARVFRNMAKEIVRKDREIHKLRHQLQTERNSRSDHEATGRHWHEKYLEMADAFDQCEAKLREAEGRFRAKVQEFETMCDSHAKIMRECMIQEAAMQNEIDQAKRTAKRTWRPNVAKAAEAMPTRRRHTGGSWASEIKLLPKPEVVVEEYDWKAHRVPEHLQERLREVAHGEPVQHGPTLLEIVERNPDLIEAMERQIADDVPRVLS